MQRTWTTRVLVSCALALVAFSNSAEAAERGRTDQHCLIDVVGETADGAFVTAPPRCFASFASVAHQLGVQAASTSETRAAVVSLSFTIGVHYDGLNFTGSSITVTGDNCAGGYLNLSSDWRNRISSTVNGCSKVRFFNYVNLGGTYETTTSNRNLTTHNNLADSVQYLTV